MNLPPKIDKFLEGKALYRVQGVITSLASVFLYLKSTPGVANLRCDVLRVSV